MESGAEGPGEKRPFIGRAGSWLGADPGLWLALLALLASFGLSARAIVDSAGIDFYHFWLVGQAVEQDGARDIYSAEARERLGRLYWERAQGPDASPRQRQAAEHFKSLATTGTPFLYAAFQPFLGGHYDADRVTFGLVSQIVLVAAVAALCARMGYGALATLLALVFVLVGFEPVASDARVGNINRLQLAILALWIWLERDPAPRPGRATDVLGGLVLGLGVMFKPNLAFPFAALLLFWWASGQRARLRAHVWGAALGAGAAIAVSSLLFGSVRVWLAWLEATTRLTSDFALLVEDGNFSLGRTLERGFGLRAAPTLLTWGAGAITCGALVWSGRIWAERELAVDRALRDRDVLVVGLGGALSLLVSPLAWVHYFIVALILMLWVLRPVRLETRMALGQRAAAVCAVAAAAMSPVLHPLLVGGAHAWSLVGNAGLLILWVIGLLDLRLRTAEALPRRVTDEVGRDGPQYHDLLDEGLPNPARADSHGPVGF